MFNKLPDNMGFKNYPVHAWASSLTTQSLQVQLNQTFTCKLVADVS